MAQTTCPACGGSGVTLIILPNGTEVVTCGICGGTGKV